MSLNAVSALKDGFRLLTALLYWNLRKTIFALRGRRGRAPCQSHSDDEVVGCIRCDASMFWDDQARFQRVCPLLKEGPEGWRCSVLSSEVRSFWGRMLKWYSAVALALFLAGSLTFWGVVNLVGDAHVPLWRVVWPGAWSSIPRIQSAELYRQSLVAFNQGDYGRAYRALRSSRMRDPDNYASALLMAQISMFERNYVFSDHEYEQLLSKYPDQFKLTAVKYHDALLSLNRMDKLAEHSLAMVEQDRGSTALWVKSLLLAMRVPEVARGIAENHAEATQRLPDFARMLVKAQIMQAQSEIETARDSLSEPFRGPWNLQYMQEQIGLLLRLNDPTAAATLLGYYGPALLMHESMAQQYLIEHSMGDEWSARGVFAGLLQTAMDARKILRLQLLLIQAPDRESYLRLHVRLRENPALTGEVNGAVMWLVGLICGAEEEALSWRQSGKVILGVNYPDIDHVDFEVTRIADAHSVPRIINVVDLPREVIWELLARMHRESYPQGIGE